MNILITGATGFIGKHIIERLSDNTHKIVLLVRKSSFEKAKNIFASNKNIQIIEGDISTSGLTNNHSKDQIQSSLDCIINLAATYDLKVSKEEAIKNNTQGTENVLNFAKECSNLRFFHHISTYAVSGKLNGDINEDFLASEENFTDFYGLTKMQSEKKVREFDLGNIKKRIYRPGVVVGSLSDGYIEKIDGPYFLLKLVKKHAKLLRFFNFLKYIPLPYSKQARLPLVPVDILSKWIVTSVQNPAPGLETRSYHLTGDSPFLIKDLCIKIFKAYGINLTPIPIGSNPLITRLLPLLSIPSELVTYMNKKAKYDLTNLQEDYPQREKFSLDEIMKEFINGYDKFQGKK